MKKFWLMLLLPIFALAMTACELDLDDDDELEIDDRFQRGTPSVVME